MTVRGNHDFVVTRQASPCSFRLSQRRYLPRLHQFKIGSGKEVSSSLEKPSVLMMLLS